MSQVFFVTELLSVVDVDVVVVAVVVDVVVDVVNVVVESERHR